MPYEVEQDELYLTWCEYAFDYPCGIEWCSKKIFGIKIHYPCGIEWCTAKIPYPCFQHRKVKKICYKCSYVRMVCWGFWCYSYCCEGGHEYGSWTGAAFLQFGESYNRAGGTFCFDDKLDDQGVCKGLPVDPQDSRPPDDPRTYPPGDGGTVYGSSGITRYDIKQKHIGLGDMIKYITSAIGIKPCAGCQKRAEQLNRLFSVTISDKR
jgi:hypothetical protein